MSIRFSNRYNRCLEEENQVNILAQAKSDLSSYINAATSPDTQADIQKSKSAGDVTLTISGNKASDSQPTQIINVAAGDTVQNAMRTQANDTLIRNGGSVKITGDGFGESVVYTKKTIEEAHIKNIVSNGLSFTKRDLLNCVGLKKKK